MLATESLKIPHALEGTKRQKLQAVRPAHERFPIRPELSWAFLQVLPFVLVRLGHI